jgi:hypothetical protein
MENIQSLRNELFETIKALRSKQIDPDTAKAINAIGQTIVNSAKVEVDFLSSVGGTTGTGFIPMAQIAPPSKKALSGGQSE